VLEDRQESLSESTTTQGPPRASKALNPQTRCGSTPSVSASKWPAQSVTSIGTRGNFKVVNTESGDDYRSDAVLVVTGSRYRRLNVPGEEDLIGAGIHFCATCDGPFYKDEEMLVVRGGNSGFEEGLFLTKFGTKVTILEAGDTPRASRIFQEQVENNQRWKFAQTPPFGSSKATRR